MTRDRLLEILCRKFPQFKFVEDSLSHFSRIKSETNRNISFFSYTIESDVNSIWYLKCWMPDREIALPFDGEEEFLEYIRDLIEGVALIEEMWTEVNTKINNLGSLHSKRDFIIRDILKN